MIKKPDRNKLRRKRHLRVRKNVFGTANRPRLNVYRSLKNIYAQIIDDETGTTLVSVSSLDKELKDIQNTANKETAKKVGQLIGEKALEKGIKQVVFDRGGYIYHGRIKELAEGAREAGLQF